MKSQIPCTSFAPGRSLPHGECERCGFQRHEHLAEHRSLPNGTGLQLSASQAPEPASVPVPQAAPVYCRQCGAGMILTPAHDADTYPCPKCGHAGPKTTAPAGREAAKSVPHSERGVKEMLSAGQKMVKAEHEKQVVAEKV